MDKEISLKVQNRKRLKAILTWFFVICTFVLALWWGISFLRPSIRKSQIRTAFIDEGEIQSSIHSSGTVEPMFEQVISCPLTTRILKVEKQAGEWVKAGDILLKLDTQELETRLKVKHQYIDLKQKKRRKLKLQLEKELIALKSDFKIQSVDLEMNQLGREQKQLLFGEGLISKTELDQVKAGQKKAKLELNKIEAEIENARQTHDLELASLETEIRILENERNEIRNQLQRASATADREGVLTWVVQQEGASIQKGETLARIADLKSYRVRATISDIHAQRITKGQSAHITIADKELVGHVQSILPTIQNGVISFLIILDHPSHYLLKPNLRVDVDIITAQKQSALRIKRGPEIDPETPSSVFVIHDTWATRTPVKFGIANFHQCEVSQGLVSGEEVIISDMSKYRHLNKIRIN